MAFMVRSVTDAASWLDSIKFIFASMLISLVLVLLLVKLVFGSIDVREIMEERTALPVVSHGIQEEEDQPKQKPDRSSIDSLRAQLSPAELAEIRRQVEEPLEE